MLFHNKIIIPVFFSKSSLFFYILVLLTLKDLSGRILSVGRIFLND